MPLSAAVPVAIRKHSKERLSEPPKTLSGTFPRIGTQCPDCNPPELCLACRFAAPDMAMTSGPVYTRKRVKRAETLYRAGAPVDCLFAIRSGFFKSTVALEDGRDQVTGFHMGGEILGMDGIGTEYHASEAIALDDSEVFMIPSARLEETDLQHQLCRVMSCELVRDQGVMLLLGTMCSAERLAAFLLNLSQRFAARGFSSREFHLRMSRDEIGSYLGLSLETVSRLFSRLQDDDLVRVDRKHIRIQDIDGLRAVTAGAND